MLKCLSRNKAVIESKYIDSIDECLLYSFAKAMQDNDYTKLLIKGKYDEIKANEAFIKIYDEYSTYINNNSVNVQFELIKQLEIKKGHYQTIKIALYMIQVINEHNIINSIDTDSFDELDFDEFISYLKEFKFDKSKGIGNEINRIYNQSKNYIRRIEADIKKIEDRRVNNKKEDFYTTIEIVQRDRSIPFNEKTTVKQFAVALKLMIQIQEQNKKKK